MKEMIFEKEFENSLISCLIQSGMSKGEAYNFYYKQYHKALEKAIINRFDYIIGLIKKSNYSKLKEIIAESPAGDGYGCNNYYIDFSDITDCTDIMSVIINLENSYTK